MEPDASEVELPRGIALAWGIATHPQRGPKRELSIEGIVEAAVRIADESGLGAVSMSSVASALGFTAMSLYRYVTAKEDLILLMQEFGTGLPPLTIAEADDWRAGLSAYSRETLAVYRAHPWLLDIAITGILGTPNFLAWLDAALSTLAGTGLTEQEKLASALLVTGQTRFEGLIEHGYDRRAAESGVSPTDRDIADAHIMGTLVTEEAFPALHSAIHAGVFTAEENPFEFGLSRVLDGIGHYIAGEGRSIPEVVEPIAAYPKDDAVKRARQARREAESRLRDARAKERDAVARARERERKASAAKAKAAEK